MEIVKDKEMFFMVQDTPFNRKYHNYKVGDLCDCLKKHNEKYVNYKKAKRKFLKSKREKKIVFMEGLHEKIRKSINKQLPSRLSSIILYDNAKDCFNLSEKWMNNAQLKPLGIFKVKCDGKLHACAVTPDEAKPKELTKKAHVDGITRFWRGDPFAEKYEYFFQGKAEIVEIVWSDV